MFLFYSSSPCIHTNPQKKKAVSLRNVLDEAREIIHFITSQSLTMTLIFCVIKRETHQKHFNCLSKDGCLEKKHLCDSLSCEPMLSFSWNTIFIWKQNQEIIIIIQTWVFGRYFLKNEPIKPVTSRKTADNSCANDEIWLFKWQL